jgi:serine/threonine protein phosphatase PrpC
MKLAATGCSVVGPAHQQDNQPNQDAVLVQGIRKGWCIAVCDGLGSRQLSHKGSRLAANLIRSSTMRSDAVDCSAETVSLDLQKNWLDAVGQNSSPYETTCLWASVDSNGLLKSAQVGDGLLLVRSEGRFSVITPERSGFGNQTQTLSQAKLCDWSFVETVLSQIGDGVLLMTDGISDDLIPEQLEPFFDAVFMQLQQTNKRRCKAWLTQELMEWSTPLHGDDKSIAGIFRTE